MLQFPSGGAGSVHQSGQVLALTMLMIPCCVTYKHPLQKENEADW